MHKPARFYGLPIGGPSLLMIFVLLCINIFAVVSYLSALQDYKLSEKTADHILQYYAADSQAKKILASILDNFKQSPESLSQEVMGIPLSFEDNPSQDILQVTYAVPIQEDMLLETRIILSKKDLSYELKTWKVVNTKIFDEDAFFLNFPEF